MTDKPIKPDSDLKASVSVPVSLLNKSNQADYRQASFQVDPQKLDLSTTVESDIEDKESSILSTKNKRPWLFITLLWLSGLGLMQFGFDVYSALMQQDWLSLLWSGTWTVGIIFVVFQIMKEFRIIRTLRRTEQQRYQGDMFRVDPGQFAALDFCSELAKDLNIESSPDYLQWKKNISQHHTNAEVIQLFNQIVLKSLDDKALGIVMNQSAKTALMVAASPLALADMLLVLWRSLAMIQEIAMLYQIKLSYWSMIRLVRQIARHMIFAGTTELATELGTDWFASELTTKLSAKLAQGLGAGVLSARLGLQTIQQCRPLTMQREDKPTLTQIRKTLLGELTSTITSFFKASVSRQESMVVEKEKPE